jgi:hypothetical protein
VADRWNTAAVFPRENNRLGLMVRYARHRNVASRCDVERVNQCSGQFGGSSEVVKLGSTVTARKK